MSNVDELSNNSQINCQTVENKWDKAIVDAKCELVTAERRVARLRTAIKIFMDNKARGVPWPTDTPRFIGQDSD